jgi:hypothetical protein
VTEPRLREPPLWWYPGVAVEAIWEHGPASLTEDWALRVTYVHLRPVPIDIGWEIALAAVRRLSEGDAAHPETRVNCTTRGWVEFSALASHYNAMKWGRPAAGYATRESSTTENPKGRHGICWSIDERGTIWTLDALLVKPYKINSGHTFSWAVC